MRTYLAVLLSALASLGSGCIHRSATYVPALTSERALRLVRAFLVQDFDEVDGRLYTAATFGEPGKDRLREAGLVGDPYADRIRAIVESDARSHRAEYSVRAHAAQARTARSGDLSKDSYQNHLEAIFLDDPRYRARILDVIAAETEMALSHVDAPETRFEEADVRRVVERFVQSLDERSKLDGCNAAPLTAIPAVAEEDPLLVTAIFEAVQSSPDDRTAEHAIRTLRESGRIATP